MPRRPETHTIAAGAGFAGDRLEPAGRALSSGLVDDVVLECLAERTLVHGLRARRGGGAGYDPRLRARFERLLPLPPGTRVISNLGAADPEAAAQAVRALGGARVAAVVGDDVLDRRRQVQWADDAQDGDWLGAHAYLGADAIASALDDGADVVLTGRCADSALVLGPLRAGLDAAPDAIAGALVVGHLLECSGQLTGGNHQAPGGARLSPSELADLGFPLARVARDGTAELALLPGAAGLIDRFTCTLQLLYEVHDPSAYITPDAVVDMTGVRFEPLGENVVGVSGARVAAPRPQRLKVIGFVALPGVIADVEIGFAGDGALERARDAGEVLRQRLPDPAIDTVGVNSLLGAASTPLLAAPPEVRLHVTVACPDEELARTVEDEVFGLTLSGPPHGGGIRVERRANVVAIDGLIDRDLVTEDVAWA